VSSLSCRTRWLEYQSIRTWLHQGLGLMVVIMIALAFRMYRLSAQSLWLDEAWTVSAANRSLPEILLYYSNIPPLHQVIVRLFIAILGTSEFSVRLPSVLAGVLSVVLVYAITTRLFNKSIGLVAGLILAISPFHVWYSQDARPYALLVVLSLASVWFFLRLRDRPNFIGFTGYVVTTTLAMYTHVYALFLLLFQNLYMLHSWRKPARLGQKWIVSQATVLVLSVPWYYFIFFIFSGHGGGVPWAGFRKEVDPIVIPYTFFVYSLGISVGPSLADLHLSRSLDLFMPYVGVLLPACIAFALMFLLGLYSTGKDKPRLPFLLLYLFVPILGAFMITVLYSRITYNVRYTAIALPAYTIILAKGITSVRRKGWRLLLILLIVGFSAHALGNYYFNAKYAKEDARSAAEYLETTVGERDVIVVLEIVQALEHYYDGPVEVHGVFPYQLASIADLQNELSQIARGHDRLWLVWSRPWVDPEASVKRYFDERYEIFDRQDFPGLQVYGYALEEAATILGAR
jgi:mannosyltransferase